MGEHNRGRFFLRFLAAVSLALLTIGVDSASADDEAPQTSSLERVRAYVQPSVVYLGLEYSGYIYDTFNQRYLGPEGTPFTVKGQCTGFVISEEGHIGTAGHCVDGAEGAASSLKQAAAKWAMENRYYQRQDLTLEQILNFNHFIVADLNGKTVDPEVKVQAAWGQSGSGSSASDNKPARIVSFKPMKESDSALLKIDAENLHPVKLSEVELEVGQEIVAIGYPGSVDKVTDLDFSPSYKDGTVSSEKTRDGGRYQVFEVSAAVSGGMSGGPVVNSKGQVVGFNSFGINPQIETQAFNFARPVSVLNELLSAAGAKNTLGSIATEYNAGLDAYFAGDKKAAIGHLQKVLDTSPNHELANDFMKKAEELPDGPMIPIWLIIVGLIVFFGMLVAVTVVILLLRRRTQRSAGNQIGTVPAPAPGAAMQPNIRAPHSAGPTPSQSASAPLRPTPRPTQQSPAPHVRPSPASPPVPSQGATTNAPTAPPGAQPTVPPPAVQQPASNRHCSQCGANVGTAERFCHRCGKPLQP